ncbi:Hypothetical predicted protein [Octopus vulgaris]|uniref:Uncharacterized protein n=1 Tax=Octopus vulgaris TaxID=6645 RepID=A0AA36BQE7_OCTVU|nr:Hypothetical predicted protein [Octopus vulgaris]
MMWKFWFGSSGCFHTHCCDDKSFLNCGGAASVGSDIGGAILDASSNGSPSVVDSGIYRDDGCLASIFTRDGVDGGGCGDGVGSSDYGVGVVCSAAVLVVFGGVGNGGVVSISRSYFQLHRNITKTSRNLLKTS